MRKCQFLSQATKNKGKTALESSEQIQASPPTKLVLFFLRWEKCLPGSDSEFTEYQMAWSVPTRCIDIDENKASSPHHGVWGSQKRC